MESSLGVAHRLRLTITFLSFSLTNRKQQRVFVAHLESFFAVISTEIQQQQILIHMWNFFSGAAMSQGHLESKCVVTHVIEIVMGIILLKF